MSNQTQQAYTQSSMKIRILWDTALKLIGQYEEFDRKLKELETKILTLSKSLNSTIENNNV